MKVGITLPTFAEDAALVLRVAREAERAGIHGLFSFDHLFPLGHPERPSLSIYPVLGAVAAATSRIRVGSLVARVGLVPDDVVLSSFESLQLLAGSRLIAGLGTGDVMSAPEHFAYGLSYLGVRAREESLDALVRSLRARGIDCWVGAGTARGASISTPTAHEAVRLDAVLNYWDVAPKELARARATSGEEVTWGGPLPSDEQGAAALLRRLQEAGASWAVWGWPKSVSLVVAAAGLAGVELGEDA